MSLRHRQFANTILNGTKFCSPNLKALIISGSKNNDTKPIWCSKLQQLTLKKNHLLLPAHCNILSQKEQCFKEMLQCHRVFFLGGEFFVCCFFFQGSGSGVETLTFNNKLCLFQKGIGCKKAIGFRIIFASIPHTVLPCPPSQLLHKKGIFEPKTLVEPNHGRNEIHTT